MTDDTRILVGAEFWEDHFPIHITREREAFTLPLHHHDFIELQYVAEGRGYHYIGDERIVAQKGDLFIIPIGTEHVYRPSSPAARDELIVYNCLFDARLPAQLAYTYPLPGDLFALLTGERSRYYQYQDKHASARQLFEEMHREFGARQPGFEAVLYALLMQLLVLLYRLETGSSPSRPAISGIEAVLAYIDAHYDQPLTLAQAARLSSTSASALHRHIKRVTGQTFTEYVQNVRIKKSVALLQQSTASVKEIAARVGYRDLKFFHKLFKKKTGSSPARYRADATARRLAAERKS